MTTIWKFPIEITDRQNITLPSGAEALHVGLDPQGAPCLWLLVDKGMPPRRRAVYVVGTGNPCDQRRDWYVGSLVIEPFVWHVFLDPREG